MSTNLTKEQFIDILLDKEVTEVDDLSLFEVIYSFDGHKAFHHQFKKLLNKDPKTRVTVYANRILKKYSSKYTIELKPEGKLGNGQWHLFFEGWHEGQYWVWKLKDNLTKALQDIKLMNNAEESNDYLSEWSTDILKLSVQDWIILLKDEKVFTDDIMKILEFVYGCSEYKSTAFDIAKYLERHPQSINLANINLGKRILKKLNCEPQKNDDGGNRYWNIIFTGDKKTLKNSQGHWFWIIRPNLVKAIEKLQWFDDELPNDCESVVYIEGEAEGKKKQYYTTKYERSRKNRMKAISIHGLFCYICHFNFEETYGELGKDYIEVHHLKPLYSKDEEIQVNPQTDLICVCSNCHRMLHRKKDEVLTPYELKSLLVRNK